ncbi:MAG TPA: hypothetical protein VEI07_17600, partial [Planctomycetaceae bacterium]|nr:hypothetical protein [Planctomycetaceae bacterium]
MVSHPFQSFATRLNELGGRRRKERRGPHDRVFGQLRRCDCAVESLEDRTLLAATALPTPTFILKGIAPAPGTNRSVSPATQSGVAPIDPAQMQAADSGNALSASNAVVINAAPLQIDQLPSITAPLSVSLNENSSYSFSGNSISVNDPAATGNSDSLSLSVSDGTLLLASTNGLTFSAGSNGSSSMTVTGTLTNLNAALNGLVYAPNAGYSGNDSLQMSLNDAGDNLTGSAAVSITVNAPPAVTAPSNVAVNENSSYTFGSGAITLVDPAASGSSDSLALAVSDGRLILSSTAGLTFASGYNGSSSMTVIGTLADLNTDLNGLRYVPNDGYSGSDSLHFALDNSLDNLTGSAAVSITVNALLEPPSVIGPSAVAVHYNGYYEFQEIYGFLLADSSASSDTLTLAVSHGTLTFLSTNGLTFLNGTSNGSSSVTVTGTLANMNEAIVGGGLDYTPTKGYLGSDTLQTVLSNPSDGLAGEDDVALTISATQGPTIAGPW